MKGATDKRIRKKRYSPAGEQGVKAFLRKLFRLVSVDCLAQTTAILKTLSAARARHDFSSPYNPDNVATYSCTSRSRESCGAGTTCALGNDHEARSPLDRRCYNYFFRYFLKVPSNSSGKENKCRIQISSQNASPKDGKKLISQDVLYVNLSIITIRT